MRRAIALALTVVLLVELAPPVVSAAPALGQANGDWSRVTALPIGERVKVELQRGLGKPATGEIVSTGESTLRIDTGKAERVFSRDDIRRIAVLTARDKARRGNNVLLWVGIAGVPLIAILGTKHIETMAIAFVGLIVVSGLLTIAAVVRHLGSGPTATVVYEVPDRR